MALAFTCVGLGVGCDPLSPEGRDANAAQAKSTPLPPPPTPDEEGARVKAEIDALDARIQSGLEKLSDALRDAEKSRGEWASLDHTVAAARAANLAVWERNKLVLGLYDQSLAGAVQEFRDRLQRAPDVYGRMAQERRALLAAAVTDLERRNYSAQIDYCEAFVVAARQRHESLFAPGEGAGARGQTFTALSLVIERVRRFAIVHQHWEEVFAADPLAGQNEELLRALFDHLALYAEDVQTLTRGVERLGAEMRRKAGVAPPKAEAEQAPSTSPQPLPTEAGRAVSPQTVAVSLPVKAREDAILSPAKIMAPAAPAQVQVDHIPVPTLPAPSAPPQRPATAFDSRPSAPVRSGTVTRTLPVEFHPPGGRPVDPRDLPPLPPPVVTVRYLGG